MSGIEMEIVRKKIMSSHQIPAYSKIKMERPRSSLFSWLLGENTDESSKVEQAEDAIKYRKSLSSLSFKHQASSKEADIKIPTRHQSRLYTPFHHDSPVADIDNNQEYKRRSCYSARLSTNTSNASLTRSASWQPSSSHQQGSSHATLQSIPDRRTSKNYTQDPDIQARLNELMKSEKTLKVTQMIAHQQSQ
ncbi:hypothetical protein BY458DRAFT_545048 [Sporodiniella umbellata]|nr:hypothetical protein BY458DRAFT_545048 [Sporodiniella umbellata]